MTRVSDLTIEELRALIRTAVREALQQERSEQSLLPPADNPQSAILDIPPLHVDPRHSALTMLSREDMYGDSGR